MGKPRQEGQKLMAGKEIDRPPYKQTALPNPGDRSTNLDRSILPVKVTEGKAKAGQSGKMKRPTPGYNTPAIFTHKSFQGKTFETKSRLRRSSIALSPIIFSGGDDPAAKTAERPVILAKRKRNTLEDDSTDQPHARNWPDFKAR